jgi:hypothetical protein
MLLRQDDAKNIPNSTAPKIYKKTVKWIAKGFMISTSKADKLFLDKAWRRNSVFEGPYFWTSPEFQSSFLFRHIRLS